MTNILVFSTAYAPYYGGAEIALENIFKNLDAKFRFFLITFRFSKALPVVEKKNNLTIFRVGRGSNFEKIFIFPFLAFFKALSVMRGQKIDLIWGMMVSSASIGGYLVKVLRPHVPFLLTLQEGDSEVHLERSRWGLIDFWWRKMIKKANRIQVISQFLADRAIEKGAKGSIVIIPNGVADEFYNKADKSAVSKYRDFLGIQESDVLIITVSRLTMKNAVDVLIKALKHLPEKFKLAVVGTGRLSEELKNLSNKLYITNRVLFLGDIGQQELPVLLQASDIFARPSRSEGLGTSFLESIAAGTPIIGTPVGGILDFLKDGENGLTAKVDDDKDLADKIYRLAQNYDLRKKLVIKGRETAEKYRWINLIPEFDKIFTELVHD